MKTIKRQCIAPMNKIKIEIRNSFLCIIFYKYTYMICNMDKTKQKSKQLQTTWNCVAFLKLFCCPMFFLYTIYILHIQHIQSYNLQQNNTQNEKENRAKCLL